MWHTGSPCQEVYTEMAYEPTYSDPYREAVLAWKITHRTWLGASGSVGQHNEVKQ